MDNTHAMVFTAIIIILIILIFLEWFLNRGERAHVFRTIPGPAFAFIMGNCLHAGSTPADMFVSLRQWAKSYKDMYRLWAFSHGVINIYNPDDIEVIFSNPKYNEKSYLYEFVKPWLRDGLLLSKGNKWQVRRKILTPAFHFNILQQYVTIFEENSLRFVKKLENGQLEQELDVGTLMSDVTLNLICETFMGIKLDEEASGEAQVYKNAIYEMCKLAIYRTVRIWLTSDLIFYFTNMGQRQREVLKIIKKFSKRIMKERRSYIEKHGLQIRRKCVEEETMPGPSKRRMAMLDLLLCAENDGLIKRDGIQEEVDTFMFAGHDTTAMGLVYALMELANNKEIQNRVIEELNGLFGKSPRIATMQDLRQMKYLECCIKETLRLYPPVPGVSRAIWEGVTLSGYVIPPGRTTCHIHIFDLHRRPDLYPDPLKFNPDRFTPENSAERHPYAYIPFSGGYRNCIGQRFAMLELKSVLSAILRRFTLEPVTKPQELVFAPDIVLRTTHPIFVKFVRRNFV